MTRQCRCRDSSGATEIDFGGRIAHAPGEVAVHGCQCAFAWSQHAEVTTNTGTAARSAYRCACLGEYLKVAKPHRLKIDLARGRDHDHACLRSNAPATQDIGGDGEIIEASIGAGTQEYLVNLYVFNFPDRHNIVHI